MKKLGIIGAMETEISMLKEKIQGISEKKIANMTFFSGTINEGEQGISIVLVKSGIGKVNAGLCAHILARDFGVELIINTGIAGAISDKLKIFDIVVSTEAVYHDVDVTGFGYPICQLPGMPLSFPASKEHQLIAINEKLVQNDINIYSGKIATGDQFISSNKGKRIIAEKTGAMCVEMEGAAIAQAAYINQVPFLIIRCISDMADDGGENTYSFNEETAANICAEFVLNFIKKC